MTAQEPVEQLGHHCGLFRVRHLSIYHPAPIRTDLVLPLIALRALAVRSHEHMDSGVFEAVQQSGPFADAAAARLPQDQDVSTEPAALDVGEQAATRSSSSSSSRATGWSSIRRSTDRSSYSVGLITFTCRLISAAGVRRRTAVQCPAWAANLRSRCARRSQRAAPTSAPDLAFKNATGVVPDL